MEKLVFFPLDSSSGLDLHRQVCVDECPVSNTATVVTYLHQSRRLGTLEDAIGAGVAETDGLLQPPAPVTDSKPTDALKVKVATTKAPAMEVKPEIPPVVEAPVAPAPPAPLVAPVEEGPSMSLNPLNGGLEPVKEAPATEEVVVRGYPSFPLAGVLCVPNVREFQGHSDLEKTGQKPRFCLFCVTSLPKQNRQKQTHTRTYFSQVCSSILEGVFGFSQATLKAFRNMSFRTVSGVQPTIKVRKYHCFDRKECCVTSSVACYRTLA